MNRKKYDILKVKNALLRRVYYVSQYITCHHSHPLQGWPVGRIEFQLSPVGKPEQQ
jgi:hypothetical protein